MVFRAARWASARRAQAREARLAAELQAREEAVCAREAERQAADAAAAAREAARQEAAAKAAAERRPVEARRAGRAQAQMEARLPLCSVVSRKLALLLDLLANSCNSCSLSSHEGRVPTHWARW